MKMKHNIEVDNVIMNNNKVTLHDQTFKKIEAKRKMSKDDEITLNREILMPIIPSPKFNNYQKFKKAKKGRTI